MARQNVLTRSRRKKADELIKRNQWAPARDLYIQICRADPADFDAWFRLGVIHGELTEFQAAETCCRKAVKLQPENVTAVANLAGALETLDRHEEALAMFERAHALAPTAPRPIASMANIHEKLGDYDKALALIRPIIDTRVADVNAAMAYARLCRHVGSSEEAVAYMQHVFEHASMTATDRTRLLFLAGTMHDQRGEYDMAFPYFRKANQSKGLHYDAPAHTGNISAVMKTFTRTSIAAMPHAANTSGVPVFIVGMPRSGTSLVEQVIASHPQVAGAGELHDLDTIVRSMSSRPDRPSVHIHEMDLFGAANVDEVAQRYLDKLNSVSSEALRVTDKLPGNFLRLGIMPLLFPQARIIHCKRDPLDTCLSCYFQDFVGHHDYAYDLRDLGQFYNQYLRLMAHWRAELDLPIYEVQYEELVRNQETISRELINFVGLDWDPACLKFHKSKRLVKTASYDQVRQPMYSRSAGRWRHYEKHLGPLIKVLEEG